MQTARKNRTLAKKEARSLFMIATDGTGKITKLYGPKKRNDRASILNALWDRHVTQNQAGWQIFRNAMIQLYGISLTGCDAVQDAKIAELAILAAEQDTGIETRKQAKRAKK